MKEFVLSAETAGGRINFAKELNKEQLSVILKGDGPCLVLAGAGSGKTRTITYRVAYLLEMGVAPQEILLLTFTNKASKEMLSRVESILGSYPSGLWGGTFHSIANRLLRKYATKLGYTSDFTIMDMEDSKGMIKTCIKDLKIDTKERRFPSPAVLNSVISYSRNAQMEIQDVVDLKHPNFMDVRVSIEDIARLYKDKKKSANAMDFDDLLLNILRLLNEHPDLADKLSTQFRYILVDEFQDTNTVQASIIKRLAQVHKNVLVVGDDAQSIYSFRAAEIRNILNFPDWFNEAQTFKLTSNYRSTPEILKLANASIAFNTEQYFKELAATRDGFEKPSLVPSQTARQEAKYIAEQILALNDEGVSLNNIAVLFRSAFHSQNLEMELAKRDIPYEYRGGLKFFERAHVKDVVSYLRLMTNVKDEMAWMRTLGHQPGIGLVTAGKIYKAVSGSDTLKDVMHSQEGSEIKLPPRAMKGWEGFVKIANCMLTHEEPAEIIRAVASSNYRDYIESEYPDFMDRLEDIEQFALFAEGYTKLTDFLAEVTLHDEYGAERVQTEEVHEDKIVLSTIHQAKGLEWDAVFVMRLHEGAFPHKRALAEIRGIEEERRLFYVAVTRARRHLFLTYPLTSGFDTLVMNQPSTFVSEIPRRLLEEIKLKQTSFHSPISAMSSGGSGWGYDEPTIVRNDSGEEISRPMPTSFLRGVDEL